MIKRLIIILLFLFIPFNASSFNIYGSNIYGISYVDVPIPEWNKSHTITGSTDGSQTNYQVKVTVNYGSGTDSGDTVYLNSRPLSDFSDVHFKDNDNSTELDFWIESKTNSSTADFWVEIPSIPSSPGTTDIYVYYGSANNQTNSAGNTFLAAYDPRITNDSFSVTSIVDSEGFGTLSLSSTAIIPLGSGSDFDADSIRETGNILYEPSDTGKEYKLYYSGVNSGTVYPMVAYASDPEGSWTKHGRTCVCTGEDPYTIKIGTTYYMYYEDIPNTNGSNYATSSNGLDFTEQGLITGTINTYVPVSPAVIEDSGTYYMIYEEFASRPYDIRIASSSDGIIFADQGAILTGSDSDAQWYDDGDLVPDDIIKIANTYYMTYHGGDASDTSTFMDGYASSTSLTSGWTRRISSNPFSTLSSFSSDPAGGSSTPMYVPNTSNQKIIITHKNSGIHLVQNLKGSDFNIDYNKMVILDETSTELDIDTVANTFGGVGLHTKTDIGVASNFAIRVREKIESGKTQYVTTSFGSGSFQPQSTSSVWQQVVGNGYRTLWWTSSNTLLQEITGNEPTTSSSILQTLTHTQSNRESFATYELIYLSDGTIDYTYNDSSLVSPTVSDTTYLTGSKVIGIAQGNASSDTGGQLSLEYVVVRKKVANEPTHSIWGLETKN